MPKQQPILIFQIASLGDTVVSVPVYREIARRHPDTDRYLLTNFPEGKMVAAQAILKPIGLISKTIEYPMPLRGVKNILRLYKTLTRLQPSHLYYLTPETKTRNLIRHIAFFGLCGIRSFSGVPWSENLRFSRELIPGQLWESEASRLLRSIQPGRSPGPPLEADRSLSISEEESIKADSALSRASCRHFVAISVGGKVPINDWGDRHWSELLSALSLQYPGLAAVLVGSADERHRNELLAQSWHGPIFNSCGLFSPRETAALLHRADLFIGHDTSTLHLAAASGTPVVGIFSARNRPGKWFSDRPGDVFLYKSVDCMGCELVHQEQCPNARKCILSITPEAVFKAAHKFLKKSEIISTLRASAPVGNEYLP